MSPRRSCRAFQDNGPWHQRGIASPTPEYELNSPTGPGGYGTCLIPKREHAWELPQHGVLTDQSEPSTQEREEDVVRRQKQNAPWRLC